MKLENTFDNHKSDIISMTSQSDVKTNEFLRRRKLRLQQVREQSKNIAKKIRERACAGKLQFITDTDIDKEKEYLIHQDNLIQHLQEYYRKGLNNLGDGHRNASEVDNQDKHTKQLDKSKLRGKEAIAELRRKKQEKLDEHKKVLDRKLQAREEANEISKEKSVSIANKLSVKHQLNKNTDKPRTDTVHEVNENNSTNNNDNKITNENSKNVTDMSTQWDHDTPTEWEPSIPTLTLPTDESAPPDVNPPDKNKKKDLFALSDEMPSSLRGGLTNVSEQVVYNRPSKLVSEYLQNRNLNLRQQGPLPSGTKHTDDLPKLRQTILKTRSSSTAGVCVLDEQLIPMPVWHPEKNCSFCSNDNKNTNAYIPVGNKKLAITNSEFNKIYSSICSSHLQSPNPHSCAQRAHPTKTQTPKTNYSPHNSNSCRDNKSLDHKLGKKPSVTIYNHSTRDIRELPYDDENVVVRDERSQEDAYSQASKINSRTQLDDHNKPKEHNSRSKIAVSKLNVEKEYKETVGFLNTLQKSRSPKPVIRNAYKTDKQQKAHTSKQQQKLEFEYNEIENECRRNLKCRKSSLSHRRSASRSPIKTNIRDVEEDNDFQYSWMPIPESDANLAIHTIPTGVKEMRIGNNVKFSNIDGYHEYRSRHKHTPPTKDVGLERQRNKVPKEIYLHDNESSSAITDTSSNENTAIPFSEKNKDPPSNTITDSEHVVIYKVLNQKKSKSERKQKLINDIIEALREDKEHTKAYHEDECLDLKTFVNSNTTENVPFKQPREGIYKTVNKNGESVTNCEIDPIEDTLNGQDRVTGAPCNISKNNNGVCKYTQAQWDIENKTERTNTRCISCQCGLCHAKPQTSGCTSASSFKTATQIIANDIDMLNERFTKLIDGKAKESQKLYVGASGLLKDDAYEVVIQLRKKDSSNTQKDDLEKIDEKKNSLCELNIEENEPKQTSCIIKENNQKVDDMNFINVQEQNTEENKTLELLPEKNTNNVLKLEDNNTRQTSCSSNVPVQQDSVLPSETLEKPCDHKTSSTQTSFTSPNPQSILNQMSSSASTSYMSPPESVLPSYLRNKHCSGDQKCQQNIEVEESANSSDHKNCACRKCRHTRKIVLKVHSESQTETPLPSLRFTASERNMHDSNDVDSQDTKHKRNQCRKLRNHKVAKVYANSYSPSYTSMKKSNELKLKKVRESSAPLISMNKHKIRGSIDLNPIVRSYVNKLLSLNKESLRAIEVVKQDCSSISTPGSSVIDLPNNFDKNETKSQKKISLEQIKEDIICQLVDKINKKTAEDINALNNNNDSLYDMINKISATTTSKKKPVHKVKSLKITKKLTQRANKPQQIKAPKKAVKSISSKRPFDKNIVCCNMKTAKLNNTTKEPVMTRKRDKNPKGKRVDDQYINNNYASAVSSYTILTPAVKHYEDKSNVLTESKSTIPVHISTQTSQEINFIKVAESKLQNMEKIADLTEKCTMRLSNLAKVLDEVRKSKSAAYSQISTPDPSLDYDRKSIDKDIETVGNDGFVSPTETQPKTIHISVPRIETNNEGTSNYIPVINDVTSPESSSFEQTSVPSNLTAINIDQICSKFKGKPPPAIVNSKLKDCQAKVVPHELSTVIEVDSPVSAKFKSRNETSNLTAYNDNFEFKEKPAGSLPCKNNAPPNDTTNPDILQNYKTIQQIEKSANNSSDQSKAQMIDINQFNKIMLQPFISINDYAKDYNIHSLDKATNNKAVVKNDVIADDISSLHSEGSLPDVVSELLKRNIIAEPFKFDSGNSTTLSSDTTLSMFATSKQKKEQKKTLIRFENKENLGDTSDTLSISSNPDLEHAFKKIGMGWASSTLKKTKERLALSSSSNTSSSSISHFKIKSNKDIPALVTDSLTLGLKDSKKRSLDKPKTIEQQTSFSNSMTVKEFLTNELAKRITFASTSNRSDGDMDFISMYETKIPEEMKRNMPVGADHSSDQSQNNGNRARTSTPVQLFKSITYHSSTHSNSSNGLFSNVDELSSVKGSLRNHSTSDQDNLTIPNLSLKTKKNSDNSKSE